MKHICILLAVLACTYSACAQIVLTNDLAVMKLDDRARLTSLVVRSDGAELIASPRLICGVSAKSWKTPERLENRGADAFALVFPAKNGGGEMLCRITSFGPGWTIELTDCTVPDAREIVFFEVAPTCRKYVGRLANMASDDRHGVCLRAYQTKGRMRSSGDGRLSVSIKSPQAFKGLQVGLVAARRADLVPALRRMTEVAGVPHTVNGGAWSLGAEGNRGSYCFADLYGFAVDDWIDFAQRGGFSTIHLHAWWKALGHYAINTSLFPGGDSEWQSVCARIHAAGLKVGMHCLTGAVQPRDSWVTPHCREDFLDWCTVTLARDLAPTDTVMYVEEPVDIDHFHTFHSYSSKGNTFRVGAELIQYAGLLSKAPYGFTGVTRGAWGTEKGGTIPAGTKLHYLYQRYNSFFPLPNSELAGKVAAAIGAKRDLGNVDQIYMDGAEAVREDANYTEDRYRERIMGKLDESMLVEGSNGDAFAWWYLSRYGAWDRPYWGMKRMHDQHLEDVERARTRNLLEAQMGWWHPETGDARHPGHKLDEMEYFAARNAACDTASSTQGTNISGINPLPFTVAQQITLFGWYERFRRARAFSAAAQAKLAPARQETRLRQDQYYGWRLFSCDPYVHRATEAQDQRKWTWNVTKKPSEAGLRVEALYYADESATNRVTLLEHGVVTSAKSEVKQSWPQQPYKNCKGCYAFAIDVCGDGSGADLWIILESAPLYHWGKSYHRVKLDFTGWRHFTFPMRERDIAQAYERTWTGENQIHPMVACATPLNMEHLLSAKVVLNDLPKNRAVRAEFKNLIALPALPRKVKRAALKFGEKRLLVPFEMKSGDFAELENGVWRLYDEGGSLIGRASGTMPRLEAGALEVAYDGETLEGAKTRAEVTLFAQHSPVAALTSPQDWSDEQKALLSYEAVMPSFYCPAKGLTALEPVYVRPGEKARLEVMICGPVAHPAITFCGETWAFDVDLKKGDRLYCRDGISWQVTRGVRRTPGAKGRLARKLPVLMGGRTDLVFTSSDPKAAEARIELVKRYTDESSWFEEHQIQVRSSNDGTLQPSYFFPAQNASPTNRAPLLVLFHTWSYNMWDLTEIYHGAIADCRKRGWSLLCPNFRGPNNTPQGCGSDLATGDIKDAIDWVKAHFPIDDDRVYAMGGSGGGHMTLLLAGRYPELWAGCAAFCPPADLVEWYPKSKALNHPYWRHLEMACGGTPETKREEYVHRSPITYAKTIREKGVNLMLITGVHDGIQGKGSVPVSVVSHMFNALADEQSRISEATIQFIGEHESVPAAERFAKKDPFYGATNPVLLRRTSGNVQYTIFEGAHGGNSAAAMWWLARQRRGVRADWSLPNAADSGYREFTK